MPQPLRIGICTDQNMDWPTTVERWRYYESLNVDSLWVCDHYTQPSRPGGWYFEGWTLLAGLAAVTQRARIGVLVSSNTFRHPALLAKEAITLDHIANGRLEVGIGAGWYVKEHEQFGIDFPETGELVERFREATELIERMLREETISYAGKHYQLADAPNHPLPLQQPRPPLTIGAKGPRMLGITARYADRWNSSGTAAELGERNKILDEHCAKIGRDPDSIIRSLYGWAALMESDPWASLGAFEEMLGSYGDAGINEFIIDQPGPEQFAVLEQVAAKYCG
jgi:alkanesulfonate monooxygenase SsuD/methylene tetrahydromethanopterin reductase-like flavin-dependent oxidoreductase (luciferase family)